MKESSQFMLVLLEIVDDGTIAFPFNKAWLLLVTVVIGGDDAVGDFKRALLRCRVPVLGLDEGMIEMVSW